MRLVSFRQALWVHITGRSRKITDVIKECRYFEQHPDMGRTLPCALCYMTHFVSVIIHFCVVEAIAVSIEELLEQVQGDRQSLRGEGKGLLGLEVSDGRHDSIHTHPPDW